MKGAPGTSLAGATSAPPPRVSSQMSVPFGPCEDSTHLSMKPSNMDEDFMAHLLVHQGTPGFLFELPKWVQNIRPASVYLRRDRCGLQGGLSHPQRWSAVGTGRPKSCRCVPAGQCACAAAGTPLLHHTSVQPGGTCYVSSTFVTVVFTRGTPVSVRVRVRENRCGRVISRWDRM